MTKTFIPITRGKKIYKFNCSDIKKLYQIKQRILPKLPTFEKFEKGLSETDSDS